MNNKEKIFALTCSREDFEELQELFDNGQLDKILDVEVSDMGLDSTENPAQSTVLSQWLKGIIEPSWEVVQTPRDNSDINLSLPDRYFSTTCKKKYNLDNSTDNNNIELVIKTQLIQSQREIDVYVRIQTPNNKDLLPAGVKLILLLGSDVLAEIEAKNSEPAIQYGLTGDIGDSFSVRLVLGEASIVEEFVI